MKLPSLHSETSTGWDKNTTLHNWQDNRSRLFHDRKANNHHCRDENKSTNPALECKTSFCLTRVKNSSRLRPCQRNAVAQPTIDRHIRLESPALAAALAAITVLDQAPGVYFVEHLLWCNPFSCDGTTAIRNPGQSTQAGNCCKATPDTAAVTMIQIMFQWRTNASTAQSAVNSTTRQSSVDHCGSHN